MIDSVSSLNAGGDMLAATGDDPADTLLKLVTSNSSAMTPSMSLK